MNARLQQPSGSITPSAEFATLETALNERFIDAVAAGQIDDRYMYTMVGRRLDAPHAVGVFCLANTVEPLGHHKTEQLRIGLPIARASKDMPKPILGEVDGDEEAPHYFYLKYMARRGGPKELRIDPAVYASQLLRRYRPPVADFAQKVQDFQVIPIRERPSLTS